jgi:hypothetical protein
MRPTAHPRLFNTRGMHEDDAVPAGEQIRVLVYAPGSSRTSWIESELAHRSVLVQLGHSVGQVVSALVEDPPPRPQILVADFDDIAPGDLLHLHVLREQGWFGRIIAIGNLPPELCASLAVECVLGPPFARDALRDVITSTNFVAATTKLPVLSRTRT